MNKYIIAGGCILLFVGGIYFANGYNQKKVLREVEKAEIARGQAIESAKNAVLAQLKAEKADEIAKKEAINSERAGQLVAALKKRLRDAQLQPNGSVPNQPQTTEDPDLLKDQIIEAQSIENESQKKEIATLTEARDEWKNTALDYKRAYEKAEEARAAEYLARTAAQSATRSSRWLGRVEGFLVGVAIGYGGGKLN